MQRGFVAELASPEDCIRVIQTLKERGAYKLDVHMPYPVKEIEAALDVSPSPLPRYVFVAGLIGAIIAYLIMWYTNAIDYPLNVGGRPSHAVPAFIPITFETTVLVAGCTSFFGAVLLGGMPRLYHPLDEIEAFRSAGVDRFFLLVDSSNEAVDAEEMVALLTALGALSIEELGGHDATSSASELEPDQGSHEPT